MLTTARSLVWPASLLLATTAAFVLYGPPLPWLTWIVLAALHVVLVRSLRTPALVAWLPLVALATAIDAGANITGVLLAALVGVVFDRTPLGRPASCVVAAAAPAVFAVAVTLVSGLDVPVVFYVAGGAAVGAGSFLLSQPPAGRKGFAQLLDTTLGGAVAAGLGLLVTVAGPMLAPLAAAGVGVAASVAFARREVATAEARSVASLLRALEIKDLYTRGHGDRVAGYARLIGEELGLDPIRVDRIGLAGLLHDIGKIAVPRHLLRKRDRLAPGEYCEIQLHTPVAATLLDGLAFLEPVVPFISEHHVHVDGGGYGVAGSDGPSLEARILAVADAFDAMTTHRPYRRALTRTYAIEELRRCAGTQFDPDVVTVFTGVLEHTEFVLAAVGMESDTAARLAALGATDVPEVISANL